MDIVRVSVPTMDAAEAFKLIKQQVKVPFWSLIFILIIVLHLKVAEYGVDCLRINPVYCGNEGVFVKLSVCRDRNIPHSYWCEWGVTKRKIFKKSMVSQPPEALVESAMRHVDILDKLNFDQFKSQCKASDVFPCC